MAGVTTAAETVQFKKKDSSKKNRLDRLSDTSCSSIPGLVNICCDMYGDGQSSVRNLKPNIPNFPHLSARTVSSAPSALAAGIRGSAFGQEMEKERKNESWVTKHARFHTNENNIFILYIYIYVCILYNMKKIRSEDILQ